jgi:group I intron endonuclease
MLINRALFKYGYSTFSLEILEYCDPKDCIKREQYYIDLYKPEYNIYKTAGSPYGYKHTEEALVKLRNRKLSEEAKLLISKRMTGENRHFFGRTGEKHPLYNKPRVEGSGRPSQRLEVLDNLTNQKTVYNSMVEAALALNIRVSSISTYFAENRTTPFRKRYLFKKID